MTARTALPHALVADIGGTNTRVALARGADPVPGTIRRYRNAAFTGLDAILAAYRAETGGMACSGVCVAVAGPVANGVAVMTNLDWTIDRALLMRATGAGRVAILNDLQAQGYALGRLAPESLRSIIPGGATGVGGATKIVIGVGTGFNAAPVHDTPQGRYVAASECGHVTLPVRSTDDLALAAFVGADDGFAGVEDVLSGRGLERLFAFLAGQEGRAVQCSAQSIIEALTGPEPDRPLAAEAVRRFVRILGHATGDLALVHLPVGGIYLCGGVTRAIAPFLVEMGFADAFVDKGRFTGFMRQFPVTVIDDDYAALTGAAACLDAMPAA